MEKNKSKRKMCAQIGMKKSKEKIRRIIWNESKNEEHE